MSSDKIVTKRACSRCRKAGHRAGSPKCELVTGLGRLPSVESQPVQSPAQLLPDPYLEGIMNRLEESQDEPEEDLSEEEPEDITVPQASPRLKPVPVMKSDADVLRSFTGRADKKGPLSKRWDTIAHLKDILQKALANQPEWQEEARQAILKE